MRGVGAIEILSFVWITTEGTDVVLKLFESVAQRRLIYV